MLLYLISITISFIIPAVLTLQALQFYIQVDKRNEGSNGRDAPPPPYPVDDFEINDERAYSRDGNNRNSSYDPALLKLMTPWLRYWFCYSVVLQLQQLPILKQVLPLIPFKDVCCSILCVWLYWPNLQGSKLILEGSVLTCAKFKVREARKDGTHRVKVLNIVEYIDVVLSWGVSILETAIVKNEIWLGQTYWYKRVRFDFYGFKQSLVKEFDGSVLSLFLFKFFDHDKDFEVMQARFNGTLKNIRTIITKNVRRESNNADLGKRSVSMPNFHDTQRPSTTSSSSSPRAHKLLKTKRSFGNLRTKLQ